MWRRAWVDVVDRWNEQWPEPFRIVQNRGWGLLIQGSRERVDYGAQADVTPHLAEAAGIGARVQGLRHYYGLLLRRGGVLQLIKLLDGETVLAEPPFPWELGATYTLRLEARDDELRAWAAPGAVLPDRAAPLLLARDHERPLLGGAVALIVEQGRTASEIVLVRPL